MTAALVAGAVGAGAPGYDIAPPYAVGHDLALDDSGAIMQAVHTAAGVELIAGRPGPVGTANQEVWAFGPAESPDTREGGGHAVFQHHTASGWTVSGPPVLDTSDIPFDAGRAVSMAIAPNGEGWAVLSLPVGVGTRPNGATYTDVFVHHVPGAAGPAWRLDRPSSDAISQLEFDNATYTVSMSIASDVSGTHGYVVISDAGANYTQSASEFMRLDSGHWVVDANDGTNAQGQPTDAQGQPAGWVDAVSVDPSSGDAWAVGSAFAIQEDACTTSAVRTDGAPSEYPTCLAKAQAVLTQQPGSVIYHHDSGGWAPVPTSSLASPTSPSSLHYVNGGSAAGVAVDGRGGAWIAGVTGSSVPVRGQVQPASTSTPFVVHVGADKQAAGIYCAVGCQGALPLTDGTLTKLATAPPSAGDGGDVFLAGPAPSVLYRLRVPGDSSVGGFHQEPLTVGPVDSMAMFSGTEGWVATGFYGVAQPTLGHLTRSPDHPAVRRWPTPTSGQFAAVAEDPSGSGVAMAVGAAGIWRLDPSTGLWSAMPLPPSDRLRSISWPAHDFAVAAGGRTILQFDGTAWHRASVDGGVGGDLYSVAAMASPLTPASVPTSAGGPEATPTPGLVADRLVGWGANDQGQLGLGTTVNTSSPAAVQLAGSTLSLSAGGMPKQAYTLAVACPCPQSGGPQSGTVYAWGSNTSGQLGMPLSTSQSTVPAKVPTLAGNFVAVAAGAAHSLALDVNGAVWAWGADAQGQLGDGAPPNAAPRPEPRQVVQPNGSPLVATRIAAGGQMSLAIDTSGNVWTWGYTGTPNGNSPVPVQLPGLSHATQIAAGGDFALALAACPPADAQVPSICSSSGQELFGWGYIVPGEYATQCSKVPANVNLSAYCPPQPLTFQQDSSGHPLDVTAIAAGPLGGTSSGPPERSSGYLYSTLAVAGGKVWDVSGYDASLAASQQANPSYRGPAFALPGLSGVTSVAVGSKSDLARKNFTLVGEQDGSLWGLGYNAQGELGADPQALPSSNTPVRVPGLVTHGPVAAGFDHSLAFAASAAAVSLPGAGPGTGPAPGPGSVSAPGAQAWAVGAGGTTVRFDGHRWSVEASPVQNTLAAVAAAGGDFVAVGYDGVILVDTGQGWSRAPTPPSLGYLPQGQSAPAYPRLYAATGLADGTVLIGGEFGTLLRRDAGEPATSFHLASPSVNGTIHAISIQRGGGTLRILLSVGWVGGTELPKPDQTALDYSGWLMIGDGSTWRDADLSHVSVAESNVNGRDQTFDELPVQRDGAQGVVIDPSGSAGWAVGDSGSAWRVALDGSQPATSPMAGAAGVATDPGALGSFAFLANTGCVQGTCADALGWGTRGDVVGLEALRAIDTAAREGSLGLMMSAGDLRRIGDSSLRSMPALFDSLSIPTYAAIGAKDRNTAQAGGTCAAGTNDNATWRGVFSNRPAPWGQGGLPGSITPVGAGTAATTCGGANTHYAFDWHARGGTVRFVVLDTSNGAAGDANPADQSPQESELTWLSGLLGAGNPPTILVMNQPVLCNLNAGGDDNTLANLLRTAGVNVAGVLASAHPGNWMCNVAVAGNRLVPMYMFGGGGGRFETSANMSPAANAYDPQHGDYFSWQTISVTPDGKLDVHSMPVLESVAFGAPQGTVATRGNAIQLTGLGRIPDMGRVLQDEAPYTAYTPTNIAFPFNAAPEVAGNVVRPDYAFSSDDASILASVRVDPAHPGRPYLDSSGHTWPDSQSGLFCAFKPGTTTLHLTAGTVTARLPATVRVGSVSGTQCGPLAKLPPPVVAAVKPAVPQPVPPQPPAQGQAPVAAPPPHHVVRPNPQLQVGAVVPPPAEVVPAPPGGMGQAAAQKEREEESEAATEDANMARLDPSRRGSGPDWLPLGAAMLGAGMAGFAIAAGRRRRGGASRAAVVALGGWPPGGRRR